MCRFAFAVVALAGVAGSATAGPADFFTDKVKDFGTTPRGPVLVHYFRFTNTTNQPVTLGTARVSCGCVSAAVMKQVIAPGESSAVVAHMDTRKITNPYSLKQVVVYVPFLSPQAEEVVLKVQTVTRDDLVYSPDTLAFGTVKAGQGGTARMKVTFTSDASWNVTEVTSSGGFVKAAAKLDSRNGSVVTFEITATLDKDCPAGNWSSDVFLKTSNAGVAQLRVPVTVVVTPAMAVSPDAVQLGSVTVGNSVDKTVTVESPSPFKILEVKGADDQLKVKHDGAEAKTSHVVTLSAVPAAAGGFARTVEILTDSKDQPKVVVQVAGTVVAK